MLGALKQFTPFSQMTPERKRRIHSVLCNRQPDLTVVTDKVINGRNLAAIVRTCDAVGIQTMHSVVGDEYRVYRGTSASAQKYVDVIHHDSTSEAIGSARQQGMQIVAADLNSQSIDYREVDFTLPTALVMGAEIDGVSNDVLNAADHSIVIPMMGMVESFNVSVACAVILSEAQRQRAFAGMYGTNRMDAATYRTLFFKWAYPRLADFCDKNGMEYPALDENDDLIPGRGAVI